jgi:hypothetical protein
VLIASIRLDATPSARKKQPGGDSDARIVLDGRRAEHALGPGGISLGGGAERTELAERSGNERPDGLTPPVDGDDLVRQRNLSKSATIRKDSDQNPSKKPRPEGAGSGSQQWRHAKSHQSGLRVRSPSDLKPAVDGAHHFETHGFLGQPVSGGEKIGDLGTKVSGEPCD